MSDIDPAAVMAAHRQFGYEAQCWAGCCQWPCDPYRLAEALAAERAKVARLVSALERTEANFRSAVAGHPVRDMGENLAENRAALADQTEQGRARLVDWCRYCGCIDPGHSDDCRSLAAPRKQAS